MAVERTLNVAELIEGKKLARPQVVIALWLCTLMVLEGYDMQTLSFAAPRHSSGMACEPLRFSASFLTAQSGRLFRGAR